MSEIDTISADVAARILGVSVRLLYDLSAPRATVRSGLAGRAQRGNRPNRAKVDKKSPNHLD